MKVVVEATVINVIGRRHFAVAKLGGITVRGKQADEPGTAVRNLFFKLAGLENDDDALLAVDLAAAGADLGQQLALEDGSPAPPV
jgi:hypothetical protein